MPLVVDLHIHSHFSRATSRTLDLENIYKWCKIKGINVVATGDWTHPDWFVELQDKLIFDKGLFFLKPEISTRIDRELPESIRDNDVRFILSTEISNIYKKDNKVRKLHNLVIVPDFETAKSIISKLKKIGNLTSDGRPILGMDSKNLLQITLESNPESFFIPAHIWTPWFSMFGSKSGFDSIEECFEELAPEIRAVETGLSSDPYMNWRVKELQNLTLISNSDAHSPQKLGREANILDCNLEYSDIISTIKNNDKRFKGTIEFYPQEGMYYSDGHRKCNYICNPNKSKKLNNLCPKCGKPLILGVDHRVSEIANYDKDFRFKSKKSVEYIIPLSELIAEVKGVKSVNTKTVQNEYEAMYSCLGDEFSILREIPSKDISLAGFPEIAISIQRMREGEVYIQPGYDGVYGVIKTMKDD